MQVLPLTFLAWRPQKTRAKMDENRCNATFDWSDLLNFGEGYSVDFSDPGEQSENTPVFYDNGVGNDGFVIDSSKDGGSEGGKGVAIKVDGGMNVRVAFRTRTDIDVLDDGFKWRKYGKKQVKNSPNPRNYYRCSTSGCSVKKRVERDAVDGKYVITSYEGVHNHKSPDSADHSPVIPGRQMAGAGSMEMQPGYYSNH